MSNKGCKIKGCGKKYYARGFCRNHYSSQFHNIENRERIREVQKASYRRNRVKKLASAKARWPKYKVSLAYKLVEYRGSAKRTGKDFLLTKGDFKRFWKNPCFYCGGSVDTIGLDRVDNDIGYIIDNVVSCCTRCNKMKKNMEYEEFIALCRTIAERPIPFPR